MIKKIMKNIEDKNRERLVAIRQLEIWAQVQQQGIDTSTVSRFGFDPDLVPEEELRKLRRNEGFNKNNPYGWQSREVGGRMTTTPELYNYVVLRSGEKVPLKSAIPK
ncbi:MAG: hypothetical protein EBS89_04595 [Proteobacteria bacterium]|nr:hypothetical protein [Pseudomonadota bacterium]